MYDENLVFREGSACASYVVRLYHSRSAPPSLSLWFSAGGSRAEPREAGSVAQGLVHDAVVQHQQVDPRPAPSHRRTRRTLLMEVFRAHPKGEETQNSLEGLCVPTDLETPLDPPGGA